MSLVKQAIILEIQDYAKRALDYKFKMDTAKTEVKKNLFKKKLKKNNTEAAELFEALNRLIAKEQQAASGASDEVSIFEGRTEEADGVSTSLE